MFTCEVNLRHINEVEFPCTYLNKILDQIEMAISILMLAPNVDSLEHLRAVCSIAKGFVGKVPKEVENLRELCREIIDIAQKKTYDLENKNEEST